MIPLIDETHDIARKSWVEGAAEHGQFPVQNLPFGIFSLDGEQRRTGIAIGDWILDLKGLIGGGLLTETVAAACSRSTLNDLFALPRDERRAMRRTLSMLLSQADQAHLVRPHLHDSGGCTLHLPFQIGDYTDFFVGIHHATTLGRMFRPDTPLLPNYKYVPIGYHGRSSSIRPSGVSVRRPRGQFLEAGQTQPSFGPAQRLDYELELGLWIAGGNEQGHPIAITDAWDHMAGLSLLNDWSARDVQRWEALPLGPFLAKNFHSTISPWVVTVEALAPFRGPPPTRPAGDPEPLAYLDDADDRSHGGLSLQLEVRLTTERMREQGAASVRLSHGDTGGMYWTLAQILTHHTCNGCNLRTGDLLGTGTLSTFDDAGAASIIELTANGSRPIQLPNGEQRTFLEDGDEITLSGLAQADGRASIGFGDCRARILASG